MKPASTRRAFLQRSAFAAAGLGLGAGLGALPAFAQKEPWFKISISEWSLHRALFKHKLDHLDFARVSKEDYGIDALEYVNQFFMDKAKDRKYLAEMKKRSDDLGVKNVLIMCDDEGEIGHRNPKKRRQAAENHFKWVEAAKFLGCHAVRINAYSSGSFEEQLERCAEGLNLVAEFGATLGMNVLIENHGQISSNGKWVAALMKKVNRPNCGTLPDFGNFDKGYDRYQGVADMMPWARGVSGKSHDFDAAGNETHTDFRRMLKIVKDAGYRGYIEVEYEGPKMSEPDGIRATRRLLEKVRDELA